MLASTVADRYRVRVTDDGYDRAVAARVGYGLADMSMRRGAVT